MTNRTDAIIGGTFSLAPGVQLIEGEQGGVVWQISPLRAIRVNRAAFAILRSCQTGFSPAVSLSDASSQHAGRILSFLDGLCETQLLQWVPTHDQSRPPLVSIVVPVYNRAEDIGPCLKTLLHLNYPACRREIIVVDDASQDNTVSVVRQYDVKLIVQERNRGQSAARNAGVAAATGEIVAFIDSDCLADPNWLAELTPYFQDPRIALVGGYVGSHFRKTWLDRYEAAKSPLNMGGNCITCQQTDSDFYVPTCNMLMRRKAFLEVAGLDEAWRVGEDVDLCWKLKKRGHRLLYVPQGKVDHKHRHRFLDVFKRRFDYGTSEPALYHRHREVSKRFPRQPAGFLFYLGCCLGLLTDPVLCFSLAILVVMAKTYDNRLEIRKKVDVPLAFWEVFRSTFNNCYSLAYYVSLHLVRYYLLLFIPFSLLFPGSLWLWLGIALFPATAQYFRLRPRLPLPVFVFFFLMEQIFYQVGVFVSCLKIGNFRCYRVRLMATTAAQGPTSALFRRLRVWLTRPWHGGAVSR